MSLCWLAKTFAGSAGCPDGLAVIFFVAGVSAIATYNVCGPAVFLWVPKELASVAAGDRYVVANFNHLPSEVYPALGDEGLP